MVAVIVVAAGSGTRLGAGLPKAFVDVAGRSLLEHALAAVPEAAQLVIVAPESHLAESRALAPRAVVVAGGDTRQASVAVGSLVLSRASAPCSCTTLHARSRRRRCSSG